MQHARRESVAEGASSPLGNVLLTLSSPFATAGDQPPPPGSHVLRRGWAGMMRAGGRVVDVLPKKTSTPIVLLRLVAVIVLWLVFAFVVVEVLTFYVLIVLPLQLLVQAVRKGRARSVEHASRPATGWKPGMPPPIGLAQLPPPDAEPAVDHCAMCGGETAGASNECRYCGSPLPTISARGWHTDPLGSGSRRWYDGNEWTEHVQLQRRAS